MAALVLILLLLTAMGAASLTGRATDSRDSDYSLGLVSRRPRP